MNTMPTPLVSVVIPAYYSSLTIEDSLAALRLQTYRDFEVIVVNSSPEEQTGKIVRELFPEVEFIQISVRLLPHAARNAGVEFAQGELLVFTDPDCEAEPDWLARLVDTYVSGVSAMVGAMGFAGSNWLETGIHLCKFHKLLSGLKSSLKHCAPTANAAYSRELWQKIGPFPGEVFAGDGILSWRAAQQGQRPLFIPEAVVRHRHLDRLGDFCLQRFLRGREYSLVQFKFMGLLSSFTWLRLIFSWVTIGWVLLRAGKDAFQAGWGGAFILTLPVQAAGHWMWALGESWGAIEFIARGRSARSSAP